MTSVTIQKSDQIMMSLVHYFVTKENYAPIRIYGVKDEIWLENLEGPYRIIRISSNSIINDEQYQFDLFKMKHIIKQIKKKTLSFKLNALNICLDVSGKVDITPDKNINTIKIESLDEIKKDENLNKLFPNINNDLIETSDGLELILNVTNDINEKTENENKKFAKVFAPKKIIFTKIILILCLIMFLVTAFLDGTFGILTTFNPNLLAKIGGNNILVFRNGAYWTIITAAFLHGSMIHLVVNLYSLGIIGTQVETFIGKYKFVFIYMMSAITGSLMSLVFNPANIVSVGASGALFGLMGALLYFGYHYRLYLSDAIKNQIIPIIVINLLISFIWGFDNAAHIGGLIGGYLAAMAIGIEDKSAKKDMINGWIVLILYVGFLLSIALFIKQI